MADVNEIRALKASFLGALDTAAALEAIKSKVMALDPNAGVAEDDLEELGRADARARGVVAGAARPRSNRCAMRRRLGERV